MRAFKKKDWTIYHEDKIHEIICEFIGAQNNENISNDEIEKNLSILRRGLISKRGTGDFAKDIDGENYSTDKRRVLLNK